MRTVSEAAQQIETALKTVDKLRLYQLDDDDIDPPGLVLGPPQLTWDGYGPAPTTATFLVFLVVAVDERALERLWQFVGPVAAALDTVQDAVVQSADPGAYPAGSQNLPCYSLSVEVSL
ncbi:MULTISPECIES: hypothetical protein [Amycolatopsis]|uniref:hypothetical protein n=1 Tax=Amycolatopsis TaxID=1813 RepID=UPI000B8B6D54|nr:MULTISPECIES: hypothetical protein [Amycolatopsis]OXM73085.1 hypothetical protein CF166_11220 [Amycolatopsis sp. KNN50.9b]